MSEGIIASAAAAALVGVALGPLVAGAACRATEPNAPPGWWRGVGVPPGQLAVTAAACGGLFGLVAARSEPLAVLPAWCWLTATGVALSITDLRRRRLPHPLTAALAVGGMVLLAFAAAVEGLWPRLLSAVLASLVVFVAAAAVQMVFPAHTGGGDTALYGALAVYLGWTGLLRGLVIATAVAALVAVAVWVARGRSARIPAGPPLIAGTMIAVLSA